MQLLMESWRKYLAEATVVSDDQKTGFRQAIADSNFWTLPHTEDDVDEVGGTDNMGSPASEALMSALNAKAEELDIDLNFVITVTTEEGYELAPEDQYGGYPNNWMMTGQYRGPEDGLHVIWIELRPISEDFNMEDLNSDELIKKISLTLNHELVHYNQLKKQSANKGISDEAAWEELINDPKQIDKSGTRSGYLSRHIEVDAFAHEAAEELLDKYSPKEALDLVGKREAKGVVADYVNTLSGQPKELQKFWKKLYTQIMTSQLERTLKLTEVNYVAKRNPQRHVPNRNNIRFNTKKLLKIVKGLWRVRDVFRIYVRKKKGSPEWNSELLKVVFNIVKQVPLLSRYRLKNYLGHGALGVVFQLSNGRAIKLGYGTDWESPKENMVALTYGEENEDLTFVSLTKNLMPVFDHGIIKVDPKSPSYSPVDFNVGTDGSDMYWVEIPVLEMLDNDEKNIWDEVHDSYKSISLNYNVSHMISAVGQKELRENIIEQLNQYGTFEPQDGPILDKMMVAANAQLELDGHFQDAHADNVGKFIQSGEYVVFDN